MTKTHKWKYAAAGAAAGLVNGFFGGGGGMLLIPLLTRWCKVPDRIAFPTCVCIILPMCLISAGVYLLRTPFDLLQALPCLLGGLAGGILAGLVFRKLPTVLLRRTLALFLLWGGIKNLFW